MTTITIRPPETGEVSLSQQERWVAIREEIPAIEKPTWHPAIAKNFSLMSARIHRREVTA